MIGQGAEIDFVGDFHVVVGVRHDHVTVAVDAADVDAQIGKQLGQLVQRRDQHRTFVAETHFDHAQLVVSERKHVEGARRKATATNDAYDTTSTPLKHSHS